MTMLPTKIDNKPHGNKGLLARTLTRFRTEQRRQSRIGFLIDATASRSETWVAAQKTQGRMFAAVSGLGRLQLRLVHFGGGKVTGQRWTTDPQAVAKAMKKVECVTGLTKYLPGLDVFIDDDTRPDTIIMVGDMFEEDGVAFAAKTLALAKAGVKICAFIEGDDAQATWMFKLAAQNTGGIFARFGDDLPLNDLCQGVALLTAGGKKAVARLENKRVKQLLLTGPSEAKE